MSILFRREWNGDGYGWVAQCLEYDIAAQGVTIREAMAAFERTFVGQLVVDVAHKKMPLEGIRPAPKKYWDEFSSAISRG